MDRDTDTDKLAIIVGACATAFWLYDQVKIENGISLSMILCILFIFFGLCYIMTTGLALKTKILTGESPKTINLVKKIQRFFYNITIKFFWYALFYIIMFFILCIFNVPINLEKSLAFYLDLIFIVFLILFIFKTPRQKIESFLLFIDKKLDKAKKNQQPTPMS